MNTKRIAKISIFTAVALIIHIVESFIPLPLPVPGVKLGMANVVTLFLLFFGKEKTSVADAAIVLLCRVILGSVFGGSVVSFIYSITGGVLAFAVQALLRRVVTNSQIWVCGALGAAAHNTGQILAAIVITSTPSIALYLPILIIAGTITGIITGLIAQITVINLNKSKIL